MTTQAPWFIGERALAFVSLMLTKRKEVALRAEGGSAAPTNLLVEILQDGKATLRFFGVRMDAVLDLPTNPNAIERRHSHIKDQPVEAGIPLAEFLIGVRKPEGICRWLVEPVLENGRSLLRHQEEGLWQPLDEGTAAQMVERVRAWYDAFNGEIPTRPRGRATKTKS